MKRDAARSAGIYIKVPILRTYAVGGHPSDFDLNKIRAAYRKYGAIYIMCRSTTSHSLQRKFIRINKCDQDRQSN